MNLRFDERDEAFRQMVRSRIAQILPWDISDRHRRLLANTSHLHDQRRWFAILDAEGWSVPAWPVEHGGTGWTALQRFIFEDEMYAADAPEFHWIGSHMVGPVLYTFGSKAQCDRFLQPIRDGREIWAQGFSEPNAGSDLASLRTQARREDDVYIVNGSKIWTSGAFEADWLFCLVKTDTQGKPQRSVSCLLIDLRSPGITIRQIRQINNEAHLCEVFFDDVRVPAENLVGEEGLGWTYAKFLLDHERTTSSFIFWIKRELTRTRELGRTVVRNGRQLIHDPIWSGRLAVLAAEIEAHEWSVLRVLSEESSGFPITAAASVLKVKGSEIQQSITALQVDALGEQSLRDYGAESLDASTDPIWPDLYQGRTSRALITRAATIFGGAQQIQKNLLAKLALGL
ncbi:acyl-CoA dehydrogenase family protein [Novosphingobium cyanobacteriorum]|uniref:Acyl-CoA dehydrogenase family protein n=1 Tax=Novosphingobium cyanobacteriorum TaxID=3024215 RepID=A0ABT6CL00_9SPHN|nr:acyl-CoA dehydrogenase family protein [Novosphingobium cyanobacteriorum]MDF8334600.1 acyl-CoA dehydrogenase family protein [Novosphingobium cyanobacteriorum]